MLEHLYNKTASPVHPIRLPTPACRNSISRCEQCLTRDNCQVKGQQGGSSFISNVIDASVQWSLRYKKNSVLNIPYFLRPMIAVNNIPHFKTIFNLRPHILGWLGGLKMQWPLHNSLYPLMSFVIQLWDHTLLRMDTFTIIVTKLHYWYITFWFPLENNASHLLVCSLLFWDKGLDTGKWPMESTLCTCWGICT